MAVSVEHVMYAWQVLEHKLHGERGEEPVPHFPDDHAALFVTWKTSNHNYRGEKWILRGCIGSLSPISLHKGIADYALTSALRDSRFDPIARRELPDLRCTVSLLVNFQRADHAYDWIVGQHGIIITFYADRPSNSRPYSGTYLPEVCAEQGWSHEQCIKELVKKAGYKKKLTQEIIDTIEVERYESSKLSLTYEEYLQIKRSQS
eukprot:TRINITY_DN2033_c0_g1_i1.p1 TRINITY_DN2033_c0_g1~~TRINITY_DN2033_c0_g1_i1.p1  ORF type:complete len:205 (+),score=18.98 TRINITY_DN2033_c0_g1_i1:184-798(+)